MMSFLHFGQQKLSIWYGDSIGVPECKAFDQIGYGLCLKKCYNEKNTLN